MIATLIKKELRQHWPALTALLIINLLVLGCALIVGWRNPMLGSKFQLLQAEEGFLAITCLILGNRLVVAEYQARTQLFLEALPIPRWKMFLTKYLTGLVTLMLIGVGTFAAIALSAAATEGLTLVFLGLVATRYLLFAWLCYGFFFLTGFLGKFRWGVYGLILLGIFTIKTFTDIELSRTGPMKLVTGDFAFERSHWPTGDLQITAALIAATFIISWLLATVREGSIAGKLGERISYRDKMTFIVVLVGLFFTISLAGEKRKKEPYDTTNASIASHAAITVKITPQSDAAQLVAERLAEDLGALAEFLDIDRLPSVFVSERSDLDPDIFESGHLGGAEGVALRTNFTDPEWRYVDFLEKVVGDVVDGHSNGRVYEEPGFWVLDGFCLYWAHHRAGENPSADPLDLEGERSNLWLRALYGTQDYAQPITVRDHLRRWFVWQNRVGHHITAGIAWSGLVSLRAEVGEERFRNFLRASLGRDTPVNILTTARDLIVPPDRRFKNTTGLSLDEFLGSWNGKLDSAREKLGDQARTIPRLEGSFPFSSASDAGDSFTGDSFTGEYRFTAPADSSELSRAVLLYGDAVPFYPQVASETLLKRSPLSLDPALGEQSGTVYEDFPAGARIAHTFAAHHRILGCRIISGWQLTEVR